MLLQKPYRPPEPKPSEINTAVGRSRGEQGCQPDDQEATDDNGPVLPPCSPSCGGNYATRDQNECKKQISHSSTPPGPCHQFPMLLNAPRSSLCLNPGLAPALFCTSRLHGYVIPVKLNGGEQNHRPDPEEVRLVVDWQMWCENSSVIPEEGSAEPFR